MNKKRWILGIPILFVGILGIGIITMIVSLQSNMKTIRAIPIEELHIEELVDGTYVGEYYYEDQIGATLEVTVEDHQITDIHIVEHICGKGEIAESLLLDVIAEQSLEVDDVAGATTSSHVLKLAIQDAVKEN